MQKRPVIIDTDPGVDDTLAILLAAATPWMDIRAINPVAGNVGIEYTSENARRLAARLGLDCRIGRGAARPLIIPPRSAAAVHGQNGLGGYEFPDADKKQDEDYAWEVLYQEAVKAGGELEVIGLAPMTNIAIALLCHPDLPGLIKKITLMAGSGGAGNITPYAEFNVAVDPHACQIVLNSGIPIDMCGLDGNESCSLNTEEMYGIFDMPSKLSDAISYIAHYIHDRDTKGWGLAGSAVHDLITMACYVDPSIAEYEEVHMECELQDPERLGQTVVSVPSPEKPANVRLLRRADKEAYKQIVRDMIRSFE